MTLEEMMEIERMGISPNQPSKGSVILSLEEYERLKESAKKSNLDLEVAYGKIDQLMTLLRKVGIPVDVIRLLKPEDMNVFWDDDIDEYVRKYLIEIQLPMDRLHEKKEEEG